MADDLVTQLARSLNLPQDAARHTLNHLVATLREQLDAEGEARVPGLGTFRAADDGLEFHPDDGLARAVNHRYAGLRPIEAGFSTERRPDTPEEEDTFPTATADLLADSTPADSASEAADQETDEDTDESAPDEVGTAAFQPIDAFIEEAADEPVSDDDVEQEVSDEADPFEAAMSEPAAPSDSSPEEHPADEDVEQEQESVGPVEAEPEAEIEELQTDEDIERYDETGDADSDADEAEVMWVAPSDKPDAEHVLGPLPHDAAEDAEFDYVEDDDTEPIDESTELIAGAPIEDDDVKTADEFESDDESVFEEPVEEDELDAVSETTGMTEPATEQDEHDEHTDAEILPVDTSLDDESSSDDEPADRAVEPAVVPPPGAEDRPAVAAASSPERSRSRAGLIVVGVFLLLGLAGILWFLNRETPQPIAVDEPVVADSNTVAATTPPPDAAPADTVSTAPEDTPPAAPEPPADPLLGDADIDPTEGGFTWVVASEIDRAAAERRVQQYREQGLRSGVVAQEAAGRTRYRVSLGQFDTLDEANARRADLPADVPSDSWVLRLES